MAGTAGKSVQEGTKVTGEKLSEAGAAVKETLVVDTLARKRLSELEEENRRLREQLERQSLLEMASVSMLGYRYRRVVCESTYAAGAIPVPRFKDTCHLCISTDLLAVTRRRPGVSRS